MNNPQEEGIRQELEVSIMNLSELGQQQVLDAISDDMTLEEKLDVVADAQAADAHRENAAEYYREAAQAADAGDYERAHEFAQKAEYEVEAIAAHGGEDHTVEAALETQHLSFAEWHQEIADENAAAAADYAAHGDLDTAAHYAGVAADHQAAADAHADLGDHGGAYANPVGTSYEAGYDANTE